ncbi:hypothetical protein ACHQM5_021760 [Ranunculus cassubicifolius]
MSESPIQTPSTQSSSSTPIHSIPIEIVSEEEMGIIELALAAAKSSLSSSPIRISRSFNSTPPSPTVQSQVSFRSIESITKRRLTTAARTAICSDIEDLGNTQKRIRKIDSFLHRFRIKRALSVTDIVASEWCQKQMEFSLVGGKPKPTVAMKAGTERHVQLEQEVIQRVEIRVKQSEDVWALKFMNFIIGVNQLLFEGLTRELPLVGFVQGVWMVGIIDEIRLSTTESVQSPSLVENKTRSQPTLPCEAQKRSGKLQLMCYKYMWDILVTSDFPARRFYNFFGLNSHYILAQQIQDLSAASGFPAKTLEDVVMYYQNTCTTLSPAQDELRLRYEFQVDHSFLGEEKFKYDSALLMDQFKCSLDFWMGEKEPNYVSPEENWKCRFCKFNSICPNTSTESKPTSVECTPISVESTPTSAGSTPAQGEAAE